MRNRLLPVAWTVFVVAVLAWLVTMLSQGQVINTNFLSFLPESEAQAPEAAVGSVQRRFQRQLLILVGAPQTDDAVAAAHRVHSALEATDMFRGLTLEPNLDLPRQTAAFYFPLRFQVLGQAVRRDLQADDPDRFERAVLQQYFSPQGMVGSGLVGHDPLLFLPRFLAERAADALSAHRIVDGVLTTRSADKTYVIILGELDQSPFLLSVQDAVGGALSRLRTALAGDVPGAEILVTGMLPYAIAGTASAYHDISTVGTVSILGIVLLLVGIFRSWRPLGLSLLSIIAGCIGGAAACLVVFGEIHLLTLVFGSSLVGISVDYSLHYFCEQYRLRDAWSPARALRHIFPGITLGLLTSLIGFAGLFFAPFPGMQGMALFSSVGLLFAYGCLFTWYPALTRSMAPPRIHVVLDWVRRYGDLWRGRRGVAVGLVACLLVLVAGAGGLRLVARDDIRLLQQADPAVKAEEVRSRALIGRNIGGQFFLVQGTDAADYLAREERLTDRLRGLEEHGVLEGHIAISDFVASPARQAENLRLVAPVLTEADGALARLARRIGLAESAREATLAAFRDAVAQPPLTLDDWLASPVSEPYRHLWIGTGADKVTGLVQLRGAHDPTALKAVAAADPDVYFIDPAAAMTTAFANYRHHAVRLTLIAYGVVAALLLFRYGIVGGLAAMAVPSFAAVTSLGVLGWSGETLSLFNVMGLLLVLGIGVDYALFFRESGREAASTLLAIALSCMTTLLAFGMLSLSSTAAIHSFGLTILVGILSAFLLSPLAGVRSTACQER